MVARQLDGGALALDCALELPDRVVGLVLLAPAVSGAPDPDPDALDEATGRIIAQLEGAEDSEQVNRYEAWLWLDGPAQAEGRVSGSPRRLLTEMNATILSSGADEDAGASGVDAWSRLAEIRVPTFVVWGELDVPFVVAQSAAVLERIPGARGDRLAGMAHLPYLEAPDAVADLALDFLGAPGDDG